MQKVALRHFLNPFFLDVNSVIVAQNVQPSTLCQSVGKEEEQGSVSEERNDPGDYFPEWL